MKREVESSDHELKRLIGKMTVVDVTEHDNGLVTVMFDMSAEIAQALLAYGLKTAILNGIANIETKE